jgi:hypothetical protein
VRKILHTRTIFITIRTISSSPKINKAQPTRIQPYFHRNISFLWRCTLSKFPGTMVRITGKEAAMNPTKLARKNHSGMRISQVPIVADARGSLIPRNSKRAKYTVINPVVRGIIVLMKPLIFSNVSAMTFFEYSINARWLLVGLALN